MLDRVVAICHTEFKFDVFTEVMDYFKNIINVFKQMNYSAYKSESFEKFNRQLDALLREKSEN